MSARLSVRASRRRPAPSAAQLERRDRILDSTRVLASAGGYDAVQMRAVAEGAGVALGTLYRYFPSKVHLLVCTLETELRRTQELLDAAPPPAGTAADRVLEVLRVAGTNLRHDRGLTEAVTRAFMFADSSASEEIARVLDLVTELVSTAVDPGRVPTDQDREVAGVIADLWLAALIGWVTGRSTAEQANARMASGVRLILRG
ncbi:TetR family transcriptional regulator [Nocardioides campestrisoli]|uniref:TetR family transcriptional regulator n=1 Tax=Nocardioides campestrisoli TaxID=2736757 RepID=UPI001CD23299|nr:TetR family transcriptional regulator [Nocardioides campestrisoli]